MKSTLKAVAFDVDGTLYPNGKMVRRSIPLALIHPRFYRAFSEVRKQLREEDFVGSLLERQRILFAEKLGCTAAEAEERIQRIIFGQWENMFKRIKPYRGVVDVIKKLRSLGLKTAAMSDFPLERKLEYLGLDGLWDTAFSSEECGRLKPHPRPFEELCARLECRPEELLYVGNHPHYDIEGAGAIGCKTAFIGRHLNKNFKTDIIFTNYWEFFKKVTEKFL